MDKVSYLVFDSITENEINSVIMLDYYFEWCLNKDGAPPKVIGYWNIDTKFITQDKSTIVRLA